MKKSLLMSIGLVLMLATAGLAAEEEAALGNYLFGAKAGYIGFTDGVWAHGAVGDSLYLGLEGYAEITRNIYLGGEVGYVSSEEVTDAFLGYTVGHNRQLTFIPMELNVKYAIEVAPHFTFDFGAGMSFNYASPAEELFLYIYEASYEDSGWLFGGQLFADLTYRIKRFFMSVSWKYQITQTYELDPSISSQLYGLPLVRDILGPMIRSLLGIDTPAFDRFDFDNFRIGLTLGMEF